MWTYIIKRILWMIPTFFIITLVVFAIVRLSPGKPSYISADSDQAQEQSETTLESERRYRAEFGLDRPAILNFWPWTSKSDVQELLETIINENDEYTSSEVATAQETLSDMGEYAVAPLIEILQTTDDPKMQSLAVNALSRNAQQIIIIYDRTDIPPEMLQHIYEVKNHNYILRDKKFYTNSPADEKQEIIQFWSDWWEDPSIQEQYTFTFGEKMHSLFLDTGFARWWNMLLIHQSFGHSKLDRQPVMKKILYRIKYTIILSLLSILLTYFISIPIGIYSAYKKDSTGDRITTVILFILYSLPSFFVALLLLQLFSEGGDWIRIFPTGGFNSLEYDDMNTLERIADIAWHLFLPVICLTYASLAALSRYARTGLLDVLGSDYIRTARAKGNSELIVVGKHALRNGLIPILTLLGGLLPILIGGSVIIELIFDYPGVGTLYLDAVYNRDEPVIMAVTTIAALMTMLGILLSDISYALADPRISYE